MTRTLLTGPNDYVGPHVRGVSQQWPIQRLRLRFSLDYRTDPRNGEETIVEFILCKTTLDQAHERNRSERDPNGDRERIEGGVLGSSMNRGRPEVRPSTCPFMHLYLKRATSEGELAFTSLEIVSSLRPHSTT